MKRKFERALWAIPIGHINEDKTEEIDGYEIVWSTSMYNAKYSVKKNLKEGEIMMDKSILKLFRDINRFLKRRK